MSAVIHCLIVCILNIRSLHLDAYSLADFIPSAAAAAAAAALYETSF